MYRLFVFVFFACLPMFSFAAHRAIYITLDGTRWQDIFKKEGYFKMLWKKYAKHGTFYGEPNSHTKIEVASIPISLPSYQSQMSGVVQPCDGNYCGRIQVETMPENIFYRLNLQKKDVVTFASWKKIDFAVEHKPGTIFTNIGNHNTYDPETHVADPVMAELNQLQTMDNPQNGDRFDKYTFAQALHYFDKYQPRFMWISLTDADEAAHRGDLKGYHDALTFYDDALNQLFTLLKAKKMDKDTLIIVTTDHGRGNGEQWIDHGPEYPESKQTWAFVMNGQLVPAMEKENVHYYSTLSMRPTTESALNIKASKA